MSLNSLSNKEILQTEKDNLHKLQTLRLQRFSNNTTSKKLTEPNDSETSSTAMLPSTIESTQVAQSSNMLDALVQYIPTESVTLYVATMSAWEALNSIFPLSKEAIYWFFCLLTPILFFLIYVGERKNRGLAGFPPLRKYPWWKLIACTIAFAAWALAIPGSPYLSDRGTAGGVVAALIALFVSTILSLLEPVFESK